jgi:hydrogenase large subunit
MSTTLKISPLTRVEGHLEIEVTVEQVGGIDQVIDARAASPVFRGFETILAGRDPRDAVHYTQRICGVCPISHGLAASLALENAAALTPAENGRIVRNLVLGANYLQSHILHLYHLAAPDYINTGGLLDMSPWKPRYEGTDLVGGATAAALVGHYVQALAMRRKAHQMAAIFAGRMPCAVSFVPGGSSETVTAPAIADFRSLLDELRLFIDNTMLADANALLGLFPQYRQIGRGCGNLLAYGVFDLNATGSSKLLARGRYANGALGSVDPTRIREYVAHSWYTANSGNRTPSEGVTEPQFGKTGAYSWVKAPRYEDAVHEVGPLARMWVNGDYRYGISVMDRIAARALETKKVADAMTGWLSELQVNGPVYVHQAMPPTATGLGMTEAPRGALGHWVSLANARLARYQVVTPTAWNASPRDDAGQPGAIEQALLGTPVRDLANPLEVMRVVHSFDPCLSCAVHMLRPGKGAEEHRLALRPGV